MVTSEPWVSLHWAVLPADRLRAAMQPEGLALVLEGDVLAGKYRVEKVLGSGGMGVVVAAHHIGLDTRVAIKFLLPSMLGNRDAVARFEREARSAVRIKSEYVARVFDVGTLETGAPYMVMEFLDGGDLATWLSKRGRLPVELAVEFVLQVCVAIADAHALGIVHRDLKPANFFCVRRSDGHLSIKVLDFGISKATGGDPPGQAMSVTRTNSVMGSPLYMSPEQLRSPREVNAQTDIWAIGASLYELLTGRVPFDGESVAELAEKLATKSPLPLRALRPEIPPGLEAVVLRCLERDRGARYQNIAELAVALLKFAPKGARAQVERISAIIRSTGLATTGMELPPSRQQGADGGAGTIPPIGRTGPGGMTRNKTLNVTGAGLALGLALIALVFVVVRPTALGGRASPPRQSPTGDSPSAPIAWTAAPIAPTPEPLASTPAPIALAPETIASSAPSSAEARHEPAPPRIAPRPPSVEPRAAAPQPTASKPATSASATAPPAATKPSALMSCTPPFYFDDKGARVFKKECVK
jgi:serine/threonine-protein kinase